MDHAQLLRIQQALPAVQRWIREYVIEYASRSQSVDAFLPTSSRLRDGYPTTRLASTRVVVVDRILGPPLAELGLPEFEVDADMPPVGITYGDTYFVAREAESDEGLHFHELVHVVQWETIGHEIFLLAYGIDLALHGYGGSTLEQMAYELDERFRRGEPIRNVEKLVVARTRKFIRWIGLA